MKITKEVEPLCVLNDLELQTVSGGGTTEWGVSVGAAGAFLGMAFMAATPVGIGVLAAASIASSSLAIWHKLN